MLPSLKSGEKWKQEQTPSSNPSENSSIYHTAPFIQSSLQHCQTASDLRPPSHRGSSSVARVTETTGNLGSGPQLQNKDVPKDDIDETTPLLSNEFKDPPTIHECDDMVISNDISQKNSANVPGGQVREAADELNSLLNSSNVLLNGGITSPQTLSWMLKQFVDLYYKYPTFSHVIMILSLICILVYFYIAAHGELILTEASHIDIEQLNVMGVSDIGVNVHVVTSIVFDYSQVSNWANRILGVSAGMLLGTVLIKPLAPIDFFVELENFEDMHRLVRVIPPEVSIKLGNGEMTTLEFDTTVGVISTSAVLILNKLVSLRASGQQIIDVNVAAAFSFDVETSIRSYKSVTYNIEQLLEVDLSQKFPLNSIESLTISLNDKITDILTAEIKLETKLLKLPFNLHVGSLTWDVLLPSCKRNSFTKIGSLDTSDITIEPLSKISLAAKLKLSPLPRQVVGSCGYGKLSPLNQFIIDFLSGDLSQPLYVIASRSGDSDLPFWMQFILERVKIPILISVDQLKCKKIPVEDYIRSVEVFDTLFELNSKRKTVLASSNVRVVLDYPSIFENYRHFNINQFMGSTNLALDGSDFSQIGFDQWQSLNLNYSEENIVIDLNIDRLDASIIDSSLSARVLGDILSGKSTAVAANIDFSIDVDSTVFEGVLFDLPISLELTIPGFNVDGNLSELNTTIVSIFLVESGADQVTLLMDLDVENPLEFSIDTKDVSMSLYFASENVTLGEIRTHEIPIIPSLGSFPASVFLDIKPKSFYNDDPHKSTTKLEKFLSSYLSGNQTNITMIGHEKSIESFEKLSDTLAGMSFDFALPEAGLSNGQKGFIMSSTMHIMTSEIEFTIYNPVANSEVVIEIIKAQASFEGTTLGHLERQERLIIPPGIYTTPRLPITYASGIGGNILKKALNGDLQVHGDAIFKFGLDKFQLDLVYSGSGLTANVRL